MFSAPCWVLHWRRWRGRGEHCACEKCPTVGRSVPFKMSFIFAKIIENVFEESVCSLPIVSPVVEPPPQPLPLRPHSPAPIATHLSFLHSRNCDCEVSFEATQEDMPPLLTFSSSPQNASCHGGEVWFVLPALPATYQS